MPNKFFPKCLISNIESPFSRWICESARRPKHNIIEVFFQTASSGFKNIGFSLRSLNLLTWKGFQTEVFCSDQSVSLSLRYVSG
jgi:hypothetical protein